METEGARALEAQQESPEGPHALLRALPPAAWGFLWDPLKQWPQSPSPLVLSPQGGGNAPLSYYPGADGRAARKSPSPGYLAAWVEGNHRGAGGRTAVGEARCVQDASSPGSAWCNAHKGGRGWWEEWCSGTRSGLRRAKNLAF